jgi:hypothetical protein
MSFALTREQIRRRTKTVTRRVGWDFLKPGDLVQAVEQAQGLPRGSKVRKLAVLRVERVDDESLTEFLARPDAQAECVREGFTSTSPAEFAALLLRLHGGGPSRRFRRIEFSYVD